ncbi:hypothetical protein [Streptomyces turgidiscabies]|uniref:hypothetical protein n=1 Tax=Streptomyces turgidiscabies TaxID=85558 RepID=UPI0038F815BF
MNREQRLPMADAAATRAAGLAREAEDAAHNRDVYDRVQPLTAAGALWADIARVHAAIAATLPATESADV